MFVFQFCTNMFLWKLDFVPHSFSFSVPVCIIVIAQMFSFIFLLKVDSSSPVEISSASGQGDNAHAITFWRAVLIPVSSDQLPTIGDSYINNNDNH